MRVSEMSVGRPDTGKADLCITSQVLFAAAVEIAAIERALEWRRIVFGGVGPTDTAEKAVFFVDAVVDASVSLIGSEASGGERVVVVGGIVPVDDGLIGRRVESRDLGGCRIHAIRRNDVIGERSARTCAGLLHV